MRPVALFALAALLGGCTPRPDRAGASDAAASGAQTYLASVHIPLRPKERIKSFRVDTWDVDVLAVCQIPVGWRITAGDSATPDGVIAGEGSHGVTWLGSSRPLRRLALVRLHGPIRDQAREAQPATFAGVAELVSLEGARTVRITAANLQLVSSDGGCAG